MKLFKIFFLASLFFPECYSYAANPSLTKDELIDYYLDTDFKRDPSSPGSWNCNIDIMSNSPGDPTSLQSSLDLEASHATAQAATPVAKPTSPPSPQKRRAPSPSPLGSSATGQVLLDQSAKERAPTLMPQTKKRKYPKNRIKLPWEVRFAHLLAWQKQTGETIPESKFTSEEFPNLGSWVAAQKNKMRRKALEPQQAIKLRRAGIFLYTKGPYKTNDKNKRPRSSLHLKEALLKRNQTTS